MGPGGMKTRASLIAVITALAAHSAAAQETSYTLYGTPGNIEMPSARSAPDAEISASLSYWRLQQKASFSFQLTDRLSGTFRYGGISERNGPDTDGTFDRSFDLHFRFLDETPTRPALAIGLTDFMGTGILSSEYIVATKAVTNKVDVTAGIGWGRLGTRDGFGGGTRETGYTGEGGEVSFDKFFTGPAAFFGAVDYRYNDKLSFKAEYSSDAYERETDNGSLTQSIPLNVGVTYRYRDGATFDLAYLYGSDLAASVTLFLNPKERIPPSGRETAPQPVSAADARAAASWSITDRDTTARALATEGITLNALDVSGSTARVRFTNNRYRSQAQAMGRAARILSGTLPGGITTFVLEPMGAGIPLSATTLTRAQLETFENRANGAAVVQTSTEAGPSIENLPPADPFTWGISPYLALIVFNGNDPVQVDVGLEAKARYEITPNLVLSGAMRQSVLGARDLASEFQAPNDYPNVRTDARFYGINGGPTITKLSLAHYGRPAENLYSRVSIGYLESMYGGVSTELLWKPVESNFALGAEVNYAVQRDYDMLFGFRDFDTVSGHLSAYYSFDNGFQTQVDVGRYLAGDWGTTFSLDRTFDNGWEVGAYFTFTDMPFDQFGEGSFDKGIRITVPTDFFLGTATQRSSSTALSSLTRDGGARLNVEGRLYDIVEQGHQAGSMGDTWGRFWR